MSAGDAPLNAESLSARTCIVRATHRESGRTVAVAPGRAPVAVLRCGRIRLAPHAPPIRVDPGDLESALVCLGGTGTVRVGTERFRLAPFDVLYIPRDLHFMVAGGHAGVDIAEAAAPVDDPQPLQFIPAPFPEGGPAAPGSVSARRDRTLLGHSAVRLMIGVTSAAADAGVFRPGPATDDADVACLYVAGPDTDWRLECDGRPAGAIRAGDLVVGPHRCDPAGAASGAAIVILWMAGLHREGARHRPPSHGTPERSH